MKGKLLVSECVQAVCTPFINYCVHTKDLGYYSAQGCMSNKTTCANIGNINIK